MKWTSSTAYRNCRASLARGAIVVVTNPMRQTGYIFPPLTRCVLSQKTRDCLLRCRLMLGLFPVFDERGIRRQRGKLA